MQKELLSAYIDGEQVNHELTEKLCQNAELQESWANFHTIRSVMRQETNIFLGADFTAKLQLKKFKRLKLPSLNHCHRK